MKHIMAKEGLIEILQGILNTDADIGFLFRLKKNELETPVAHVRERVEQFG